MDRLLNKTPEQRKARSIAILKEHGVPYIEHLPCLESADTITPRTPEEIARRAVACLLSVQVACDICSDGDVEASIEFFKGILDTYGVAEELTFKERMVFFGEPSRQAAVDMAWKYEAYWVLIWALGLVDTLEYPDRICDCEVAIDVLRSCANFEELMKRIRLRSMEEIVDEADLIFRYDWACVDARLHNKEVPAELNPSVVLERHRALNWLIGKNTSNDDWDAVSTDT